MNPADVLKFSSRVATLNEQMWPGKVVIADQEYDVTLGNPPLEGALVPGGEVISGDLIVRIRKELMAEPPARDTRLQARGRTWVIRRVTGYGEGESSWTLSCEPHN